MKLTLVLFTIFFSVTIHAQQLSGRLTYEVGMKLHKVDSSITKEQKKYNLFFKNIPKKTYILDIDNEKSIFYLDKKMKVGTKDKTDLVAAFVGNGIYYYDTKLNKKLNQKNVLGEDFIIESNVTYKWKLTQEKKKIRNYTCFKATTIQQFTNRIGKIKTKKITAWYCPEIPLNIGIKDYHGLPGGIISLDEGDVSYKCVKIELNLKQKINIRKPTKGKFITEKEYNDILKTDFIKNFGIKNK